jgi:hypothetical protein
VIREVDLLATSALACKYMFVFGIIVSDSLWFSACTFSVPRGSEKSAVACWKLSRKLLHHSTIAFHLPFSSFMVLVQLHMHTSTTLMI